MIKIVIIGALVRPSVALLMNANVLTTTPVIMSKSILVSRTDLEAIDKILTRNVIKYKLN